MSECNWDPSKHGGKACPVHGGAGNPGTGGHKIRINQGKYEARVSDDANWEEISPEEYNDLREGGYQDFDETVDDDFGFDDNGSGNLEVFNNLYDAIELAGKEEMENELQYKVQEAFENGEISEEQYRELFDKMDEVLLYNEDMEKSQEENFRENADAEDEPAPTKQDKLAIKAGHILNDPEEYVGPHSVVKLEKLMNDKNYKVGRMEELIAKELANGEDSDDALYNAIDQLDEEMFGEPAEEPANDTDPYERPAEGVANSEEDDAGSPYKETDRQWMKDHIEDNYDNPNMSDKDLMDDILERFGELSPDDEQFVKQLLAKRKTNNPGPEEPAYRTPEDMVDGELRKTGWTDEQLKKLTRKDYDYLAEMYSRILGINFKQDNHNVKNERTDMKDAR